jgi:hypothetical protein
VRKDREGGKGKGVEENMVRKNRTDIPSNP